MSEALPVPVESLEGVVGDEEIDANGHMGSSRYLDLFHRAMRALLHPLGFGPPYRARGFSNFQREILISYDAELRLGDRFLVTSWLIGHDSKRIHHFHEMWHGRGGRRVAAAEFMTLNVDLAARRSAHFPPDIQVNLDSLAERFANVAPPAGVDGRIGLSRRRSG